jgi:hypothetical protein
VTAPVERVFADVDILLAVLLEDLVGGPEHTDSETPLDLLDRLPFIRARKVDGDRDAVYDRPIVEIDVFGPLRSVAQPIAELVFERLMRKPPPHPAIDLVVCGESPRQLPWGDGRIRRWSATYGLDLRRTKMPLL